MPSNSARPSAPAYSGTSRRRRQERARRRCCRVFVDVYVYVCALPIWSWRRLQGARRPEPRLRIHTHTYLEPLACLALKGSESGAKNGQRLLRRRRNGRAAFVVAVGVVPRSAGQARPATRPPTVLVGAGVSQIEMCWAPILESAQDEPVVVVIIIVIVGQSTSFVLGRRLLPLAVWPRQTLKGPAAASGRRNQTEQERERECVVFHARVGQQAAAGAALSAAASAASAPKEPITASPADSSF